HWTGYQNETQHILVSLAEDETVAGFAAFKPDEHLEGCIYLDSLHVRADRQGQGIGTALIKAAAALAEAAGYASMSISIVRGNERAGDLYRKLGARHVRYFTDHFAEAESRSEELLWDDIRVLLSE
ncbi:MAG: GNAT family N-acetyltransferase, partial [Solobacterium sp.]|nr:GNAT family N-acetyltransferase [Solobacterium sp.]